MKLKELLQILQGRGLQNDTLICSSVADLEARLCREVFGTAAPLAEQDYTLPAAAERKLLLGADELELYAEYALAQEHLSRGEGPAYNTALQAAQQRLGQVAARCRKQKRPPKISLNYWS